jgi:endonuclease/exonuclease/phosphatase family metal-dependent hydrolase
LLIRIVTYNIHRAIGVDRRFRPERIIRILHHHNPDVVLLQEVDEGVPRSRELDMARELARELGFPHFAVGHNVSLRRGRYGNATLSRFPILRERNIDLSLASSWIRRGCQHTSIRISDAGAPLEVFNLHLGLSARERELQVHLLARSAELAELEPAAPCLVAGDFNDWRSLLRPAFTNGLGFQCATDRRPGRVRRSAKARPLLTFPSLSPRGGLDRIYFRGSLNLLGVRRCRLQVSRLASDHLPVIAEFQMP